jgi:hypothetical protein
MIEIPATTSTNVVHGVLIEITVNGTEYTIANTYGPVDYSGKTYLGLGHLIGFAEIQDDLRATNNTLQMSLSGIPKDPGEQGLGTWTSYVSMILDQNIKGSSVNIRRAFFDPVTKAIDEGSVSLRFSGYISNYSITDSSDIDSRIETYTCVVMLSSIHAILERKISGRRTNSTDQKALYPTDISMDRVTAISNTQFDFGKPLGTGGNTGAGSGGNPGTVSDRPVIEQNDISQAGF